MSKNAAGFTLLELLLIILIIGFATTLVSLSINTADSSSDIKVQAVGFANATSLVVEEAVLDNQLWGIDLYRDNQDGEDVFAYRWLRLSDYGWLPDAPNDMAMEIFFSVNIVLELELESVDKLIDDKLEIKPEQLEKLRTLDELSFGQITDDATLNVKKSALIPDIIISPNREVSPFILTLRSIEDDQYYEVVRVDLIGRITLEGEAENESLEE
jgi:type II secretory pathway pseudopilin PulG